jgi:hypothetical protein
MRWGRAGVTLGEKQERMQERWEREKERDR